MFSNLIYLKIMNLDGSMANTTPHQMFVPEFDLDMAENMLYYYHLEAHRISRAPLDQDIHETVRHVVARDIAVDWIGR